MDKFYYLIASLPTLVFGEKAPITWDAFEAECGKWMNEKEKKLVKGTDINETREQEADPDPIKRWKRFDLKMKKDLAKIRDPHKPPIQRDDQRVLKEQLDRKNPLEKEKVIGRIKWDFLEGEEHKYNFDLNKVLIYGLKLRITGRFSVFEKEKGKTILEKVCEVKNGQINW